MRCRYAIDVHQGHNIALPIVLNLLMQMDHESVVSGTEGRGQSSVDWRQE